MKHTKIFVSVNLVGAKNMVVFNYCLQNTIRLIQDTLI